MKDPVNNMKEDLTFDRELEKFKSGFKSELPHSLQSIRFFDLEIEVEHRSKPPHIPSCQLSPAEEKAAKEYIKNLLKRRKFRSSKCLYCALLFFVKEKDKLKGAIDYRDFNTNTKTSSSILRTDEILACIGGSKLFQRFS